MNTIINQRYRLLTVLGKGAQGVVYLAMDQLRDDQQVALKVLTAVHFNAVLRFEFAQAAKLDHPHLARVYDFGIIAQHEAGDASLPRGAAFFTQEFVAGLPAQRWAAPLRGDERIFDIVKVGVQVARGLALMHRCGLIHRDVKPANIVVNKTGTSAKLIDFGLAVSMDALDGMKAGTLAFMAPEAVHGFPDVRSDIFSLGATLITLLGGAPQRQPSAMLPRLPDDTPLALATALTRMVHPRASDRFQNASDVVLALAGAVGASVLGESRGDVVVDAATDSSDAAARWSRSRSPELVGRDALLETLASWMGEERGIRTGILIGPAGVGKTRLFRTAVVARQLECGAEGGATPPQFLAGTLRQLVRTLMRSVGHDNTLLVRWLKGADLLDIHGGSAAESLIEEMVSLIRAAITLPTVVLVEGAQSVLEVGLLERLAKETGPTDRGIWVAVEARELGRAAADSRHLLVEVPPLTEQAEQELITLVLGRKPNASYAGSIHRMTGGIPALTEAVLAALLAKRPDGKIEAASLDEVALGGKPTQMLQEVLETLPGTVRRVAEALAVAATPLTEVEVSVLAELSDPAQLTSALADLEGRGWISLDSDEVVMRRLVGEVLLESLSSSRRTGISRRMVSVLDARTAPLWQRVHHAVNAGMVSEAKGHVDAAVKALQGSGDLPGAAILLESYLSHISNDDPDTDRYETELARLYRQTGEYRAAIRHAEAVEKRGGSSADEAALEKAASLRLVGAADEATTMLERLSHAEDGRVAVNARVQLARLALDSGRRLEASEHLSGIAIDAFREAGPDTLNTVGLIALFAGDDQKARTLFQRGLADAERAGDIRSQARFHGLLGMVCHGRSGWRDASECYENAFRLAEKAGDRHGAATYQTNLAAALTEEGRLEEALNAYRDGLERLRIFGRPEEIAQASANYAELLHRLGDLDAADRASIAAVNHGRAAGHRPLALALCVRGDLLLSRGALDDAEEMLYKAELLAETDALSTERNVARLHLTALAIARNRLIEAEEKLESISVADLSGAPTLALTHRRLTLVLALEGVGDVERALRSLIEMLPASTRDARAEHLSAFFWVARGANMLGSVDRARWAASAALGILERIRRETPSLYHQADTPMLKEMNRILRADSTVEAPEETRADWRRLARINTRLNSEIRVGRLLEIVMDAALDITGAERGFLLIANPKGELKVGCARNMDKASLLPDDESFSRTVAMRAFTSAEPVLTTDAREDARFNAMRSVVNLNLRYIVAVPLSVSQKPTGTIYLDSRHGGHFDDDRLALLEALADQAAIALTNARLRSEIRQRQAKIERLNRALAERLESSEGELKRVKGELEKRTDELIFRYRYDEIIARSKPMTALFRLLDRVVTGDYPVIIQGESGTGKELVARAIHFNSCRKRRPFVAENCAAIPDTLLESVLFGHVKGAFTGAVTDAPGLFVEADQGTLFLDEIGEMSLGMQAKLLRVLQNGEVRPVGGAKTRNVDVRVLVATNADLKQQIKEDAFREDLFYRLSVIDITLPPLRKRKEDIPLLVEHFIQKHGDGSRRITTQAMEALMDFQWPGNVRQLENEMLRAVVLSEEEIRLDHLSEELVSGAGRIYESVADFDLADQVDRLKRRLVSQAMRKVGGNQTAAAELLGLSRYGLQKMLKRFGI